MAHLIQVTSHNPFLTVFFHSFIILANICNSKIMQHLSSLQTIKQKGRRLTTQRAIILEAIKKHQGHIKTDTFIAEIKKKQPYIDISTIYRTLSLLTKLGILQEIHTHTGTEYEMAQTHSHQHLICKNCGFIDEIQSHAFDKLQKTIKSQYHFAPDINHLAIFGICVKCQEDN